MNFEEASTSINLFLKCCTELKDVAKTAEKNRKSLSGHNFYGDKFHGLLVDLCKQEVGIINLIRNVGLEDLLSSKFSPNCEIVKSASSKSAKRAESIKQIRMFLQAEVLPKLESLSANPVPATEQILPMEVVAGTRSYIEKIVMQANGCYEHQWYDSCAVMIRRLTETLIIELFESRGKESDIQDKDNNYFMLSVLIERTLADPSWNLSRETKQSLPLLKSLGDRSAHNRRYLAKKIDIDKVIHGLRVTTDDILHLSKLK